MIDRAKGAVESNIDNSFYDALGMGGWWDSDGSQQGLHEMNPLRASYFQEKLVKEGVPAGAKVIEIGCGGGILSEAMAGMGYEVHGFDQSEGSIDVARSHAQEKGIPESRLRYSIGDAYELPLDDMCADVIVMSDVLEHLDDLPRAVREVGRVLKSKGVFVFDTFNRTIMSYLFGILGAQILLKIVPSHCHDWNLFVTPHELSRVLGACDMKICDLKGMSVYMNPLHVLSFYFTGKKPVMSFQLIDSLSVQYIGYAVKASETGTTEATTTVVGASQPTFRIESDTQAYIRGVSIGVTLSMMVLALLGPDKRRK
eukprot:GSChrysophyteH1.ASY1.ANO1.1497.1 assembled CDS